MDVDGAEGDNEEDDEPVGQDEEVHDGTSVTGTLGGSSLGLDLPRPLILSQLISRPQTPSSSNKDTPPSSQSRMEAALDDEDPLTRLSRAAQVAEESDDHAHGDSSSEGG